MTGRSVSFEAYTEPAATDELRGARMESTMSRTTRRAVLMVLAAAGGAMSLTMAVSGQTTGQPSTKNGEWPAYTGDVRGSRFSPLDQINASNFNKLEVAWRFKTD